MINLTGWIPFRSLLVATLLSLGASETIFAKSPLVRSVTGSPKYMVAGVPTPLFKGDKVPPGTVIQTGAQDRVEIIVGENHKVVSLGPNSQLRVETDDKYLVLDKGEVVGSVRPGAKKDSDPLTIKSPLGVTKADGGDFSISTWENSIKVVSGKNVQHQPIDFPTGNPMNSSIRIPPGSAFMNQQSGPMVSPLAGKASAALLQQIDKMVSVEKGGPTVKAAASVNITSPEQFPNPGTGTPGYWKNHADAWPVSGITIGGINYTVAAAIANMQTSKTDRTYSMFQDLVCAILNKDIGNDPTCINSYITSAQAWMTAHPVGSGVDGGSAAWTQGDPIHQQLDAYNNGLLCAPHRT